MKARVKATGEIIEVRGIYTPTIRTFGMEEIESFDMKEVEIITDPDYWERLKHQYAGMAMQGMLNNSLLINGLLKVNKSHEDIVAEVTGTAIRYAHALVQKLKEKEERK